MSTEIVTDSVLELSTEAVPAKKFTIDGEEYDLLNYDHLSSEQEASVTALFARFQKIYGRLEEATNDSKAAAEALRLNKYREKLIRQMTTVPQDVLDKLGPAAQGKILTAIQNEISVSVDDEDDDRADPDDD